MSFHTLPRTEQAKACVRWNPKSRLYELVVGGAVLSSISRLRMSIPREQAKFRAQASMTLAAIRVKQ